LPLELEDSTQSFVDVKIGSPQFKANPYPFFARLRSELPVYRVALPGKLDAWLITRYDDVFAALKDERLAKDRFNALTPDQKKKQLWVPKFFRLLPATCWTLTRPTTPGCAAWFIRRSRRASWSPCATV
jgi:cytochrome P450